MFLQMSVRPQGGWVSLVLCPFRGWVSLVQSPFQGLGMSRGDEY